MIYLMLFLLFFVLYLFNPAWAEQKEEAKLEEIVVTATRTETPVESVPASVSVVSKDKIELKSPKTIDQALNDLPGVFVRRGKGLMDTLSSITLRGVPDQKRTLILMDGIVLNNPYSGNIKFGGTFPEDLERVEVVRGPFSSLYGGYAMGGVVNFVTKMPEKREFTFKTGYGSSWERGEAMDDLRRIYMSYGDKLWNKLSIFLSYGWQGTNGYPSDLNVQTKKPPAGITGYEITTTRDGKIAYLIGDRGDNRWWDDGITIKTQYEFTKDTKINLSFMRNRYEYNYDDPHTYLKNASGNPVWSYSDVYENSFLSGAGGRIQNTYALGLETNLYKDLKMKLNLSYIDTEKDWYVSTSAYSQATRYGCGSDPTKCGHVSNTPAKAYMADLQFTMPIFGNQILTFGGSFRHGYANTKEKYLRNWKDENSTTTLKYESRGKDRTYAIFVQDEIMLLNNLTAYIGFRQDWWKTYDGYVNDVSSNTKESYPERSKSSFSPKFAIVYKPFDVTTLRGSIGKAFRPPTVYELYRTWRSDGKTYVSNPNLDPEKVTSWDMGVEQKLWKDAKLSLTYFENYFKDMLYRKTTGSDQNWVNVGKAESRGIEFEIEQRFEKWLRLFCNFTYTDSEIKENPLNRQSEGKRFTQLPLKMANLGIEFQKYDFSAYLVSRYVSKRYSSDTNSDYVNNVYGSYDPYFVVDGRIAYDITKFAKLSFSVDNIFDRKYYSNYRAPGRSWFTELTLKF